MGGFFWRMGWAWIALGAMATPIEVIAEAEPAQYGSDRAWAVAAVERAADEVDEVSVSPGQELAGRVELGQVDLVVDLPGYMQRGQALLARVPYNPASIGYTVEFLPAKPGYRGLTWAGSRRIEIFVGDDISDNHLAHVIAHEIGHAIDIVKNSTEDRQAWRAARGMAPEAEWWPSARATDFASPAGDFAECFAVWAVGSWSSRSTFGSCSGTESLLAELIA